jgi:hypothetical protein
MLIEIDNFHQISRDFNILRLLNESEREIRNWLES